MAEPFRLACVQPNVGDDIAANIAEVSGLIRRAHAAGAQFIGTPENTGGMVAPGTGASRLGFTEDRHPALAKYRALAAELKTWLLIGSLWITTDDDRVNNRQFLIGADGTVQARYDKIHMFDVDLANGEQYRESKSFRPGERAALAQTPFGTLGMSICYDLRFAYLYRHLAQSGAQFISVPAAFTRPTGQAHWHVLLRARAIETGAFVFAPAQTGLHPGNRGTYGHSLIVAPWGEVLADGGEETGFVMAEIDLAQVDKARASVPAWRADRSFAPVAPLPRAAE
jgi:predicted amidohydrolase